MTFRNPLPTYPWALAAFWWAMLISMTLVFVRDGPPAGYAMPTVWAILCIFGVGGAGLAAFALSKLCFNAGIEPGVGVSVTLRYPFKVARTFFPRELVVPPTVVEDKDSECAPYFYARLLLVDRSAIDIAEGHDRDNCESACQRSIAKTDYFCFRVRS